MWIKRNRDTRTQNERIYMKKKYIYTSCVVLGGWGGHCMLSDAALNSPVTNGVLVASRHYGGIRTLSMGRTCVSGLVLYLYLGPVSIHMMTSSNGNFSALLAICAGNSPVPGEFPTQRPVTRSFDVFFDLRLNKRLSKQSWSWWFETLSRPLRRHCNGGRDKWPTFTRRHFQIHFLEWKCVNFDEDFTEICSHGPN